jgi:hypothetical protein
MSRVSESLELWKMGVRYGWLSAGRLPARRRVKRTFRQWLVLAESGLTASCSSAGASGRRGFGTN